MLPNHSLQTIFLQWLTNLDLVTMNDSASNRQQSFVVSNIIWENNTKEKINLRQERLLCKAFSFVWNIDFHKEKLINSKYNSREKFYSCHNYVILVSKQCHKIICFGTYLFYDCQTYRMKMGNFANTRQICIKFRCIRHYWKKNTKQN